MCETGTCRGGGEGGGFLRIDGERMRILWVRYLYPGLCRINLSAFNHFPAGCVIMLPENVGEESQATTAITCLMNNSLASSALKLRAS